MEGELFYQDGIITLYTGDALGVLSTLRSRSVHCVVTSPPYWGLRNYGTARWIGGVTTCRHDAGQPAVGGDATTPAPMPHPANRPTLQRGRVLEQQRVHPASMCVRCGALWEDRQYGLEPTLAAYIQRLRRLFRQLHRVLVDDGTVWLNLGDRYSTRSSTGRTAHNGVPSKNLLGIPWRTALVLQGDGWLIRNAIVWSKPNAMPESVTDRLSCRYELLFLLTKQPRYWFDLDAIRQPLTRPEALDSGIMFGGARKGRHAGVDSTQRRRGRNTYGRTEQDGAEPRGKNPGDVWTISTRPLRAAHFAAFPVDIPLRCIAAGCPPDGRVLDPFSGAATTALAARQLKRSYVGIDLNPDFHDIGLDRLRAHGYLADRMAA